MHAGTGQLDDSPADAEGVQVYELADELGVRSVEVLDACEAAGVEARDAGSTLDDHQADDVRDRYRRGRFEAEAATRATVVPVATPAPPTESFGAPPPPTYHAAPTPPPTPPPGRGSPPMHPLVRRAIWYFVLAQVVPCVGLYFFFASYSLAGKGRRQILWYRGRWGGDTAALVIQILFWVQLVLAVVVVGFALSRLGTTTPAAPPR